MIWRGRMSDRGCWNRCNNIILAFRMANALNYIIHMMACFRFRNTVDFSCRKPLIEVNVEHWLNERQIRIRITNVRSFIERRLSNDTKYHRGFIAWIFVLLLLIKIIVRPLKTKSSSSCEEIQPWVNREEFTFLNLPRTKLHWSKLNLWLISYYGRIASINNAWNYNWPGKIIIH